MAFKVIMLLRKEPNCKSTVCRLCQFNSAFNITFIIYLNSRKGDSRGGIRADHQRHDGGAQSTKHVGELRGQRREEILNKLCK